MTDTLGPLPARVPVDRHLPTGIAIYGYTAEQMRAYAAAEVAKARAEERERCAKLVETQDTNGDHVQGWFDLLARKIRAA